MSDSEKKELWPPDDEWVPYALPWLEGRCIPEKRMNYKDGKWIFEYRYPKPREETDDEDDEPEIEMIPVVRCKDCVFGKESCGNIKCHKPGMREYESDYHQFDWFCADGERVE